MTRHKVHMWTVAVFLIGLAVGCGSEPEETQSAISEADTDTIENKYDLSEDGLAIERSISEVLMRLKYGDKSGLYESEFDYLTDETTLDKYLTFPQVQYAEADTMEYVEVVSYELSGENSAIVSVLVHFKGPSGNESTLENMIRVFKYKGRWIKPTVSNWPLQQEYEEIIRQAEEAAEEEG